jgi:hypothetical protein
LRVFWEQFYQIVDDESKEETSKWSLASKNLKWDNQFTLFEFHNKIESDMKEVKKKASAWFRVTYNPWIAYIRQNNKTKNQRQSEAQQWQFRELFSFAWLVYPVLLNIFEEKQKDAMSNKESKKRKKKKKYTAVNGKKRTNVTS